MLAEITFIYYNFSLTASVSNISGAVFLSYGENVINCFALVSFNLDESSYLIVYSVYTFCCFPAVKCCENQLLRWMLRTSVKLKLAVLVQYSSQACLVLACLDDDCDSETNTVLYTSRLPGVLRRQFSASWNIMPTSMLR